MYEPHAHTRQRPPLSVIAAATVVGTALLAAACGTAPAPGQPKVAASQRVVAVKLSNRSADSRAGAQAYGRRLLASLRLPPGARVLRWPSKPPAGLNPTTPAILTDTIDLRVLYRVEASMDQVNAFLLAHRPTTLMLDAHGSYSHFSTVTSEFVSFTPRALPAGIYSAELDATFKPAPGGTVLRADAQVAWYPPRSPAEYIEPSRYVSVTVDHRTSKATHARTVRSGPELAKLAGLVNGLYGAPDVMSDCPAAIAGAINVYQLVFTPARGALRIVVTPSTACGDYVYVTVGRRAEPSLAGGSSLIRIVQRLVRPG
ncbi:MAG TPA: hypothetical protein VME44_14975 [Streptosporangiaceae bacterium]|nr:hypothetical protein [Streptosporangiaceae bacterium]